MALTTEKLNSSDEQICDGDSAETIDKALPDGAKLYTAPPAPESTNAADWGINMQTGTPILTYKNCCVIESEQAHYVLSLINGAAMPAPAVPVEIRNAYRAEGLAEVLKDAREYAPLTAEQWGTLVKNWHQTFVGLSGDANACSAAMLAQPVSGGYKLVPAEATEDMIAAAMNCDDVSFNADETFCVNFGNIYAAMLAAAPEGGNDHDTRR